MNSNTPLTTDELRRLHPDLVDQVLSNGSNRLRYIQERVEQRHGELPKRVSGSDFKTRCSSISDIMTEPRGKGPGQKFEEAKAKYEKLLEKQQSADEGSQAKIEKAKEQLANLNERKSKNQSVVSESDEGTAKHTKAKEQVEKIINDIKVKEDQIHQFKKDRLNQLSEIEEVIKETKSELDELELRKDEVHLSETCKSVLKKWLYSHQIGGRRRVIETKYTYKGIEQEDVSIDVYGRVTGFVGQKNETRFTHDPDIEGEPDLILKTKPNLSKPDLVVDIKSSWDQDTFPMYEEQIPTKGYADQLQGYAELVDVENIELAYVLVSAPDDLIEKEMDRKAYSEGKAMLSKKEQEEIFESMWFDNIPEEMRVKRFRLKRDREFIERVRARVQECRVYIDQLIQDYEQVIEIKD